MMKRRDVSFTRVDREFIAGLCPGGECRRASVGRALSARASFKARDLLQEQRVLIADEKP